MSIVNCPECSKKLKVADTSIGKKVKCSCGTVFVAESAEASAAPSVAEKVLVACTECASKLKVAATSLGKKMKCPKCAGVFVAAIPPTAMAEETMKRPAPAEDEEEPLNFAAAQAKDDDLEDEEEMPKPKAKPRMPAIDDDGEQEGAPVPAGKPVYPSRLLVNLLVFFLVIAYGAFFAVTHPDIDLLPLGLVKPRGLHPVLLHGGNPPDGVNKADAKKDNAAPPFEKKIRPKKDKGMKGTLKKTDDGKKVDDKKDDGKKDDPKDDKQGRLTEPLRQPVVEAVAIAPRFAASAGRYRQLDRTGS